MPSVKCRRCCSFLHRSEPAFFKELRICHYCYSSGPKDRHPLHPDFIRADEEREARIEYYRLRASLELPLFTFCGIPIIEDNHSPKFLDNSGGSNACSRPTRKARRNCS